MTTFTGLPESHRKIASLQAEIDNLQHDIVCLARNYGRQPDIELVGEQMLMVVDKNSCARPGGQDCLYKDLTWKKCDFTSESYLYRSREEAQQYIAKWQETLVPDSMKREYENRITALQDRIKELEQRNKSLTNDLSRRGGELLEVSDRLAAVLSVDPIHTPTVDLAKMACDLIGHQEDTDPVRRPKADEDVRGRGWYVVDSASRRPHGGHDYLTHALKWACRADRPDCWWATKEAAEKAIEKWRANAKRDRNARFVTKKEVEINTLTEWVKESESIQSTLAPILNMPGGTDPLTLIREAARKIENQRKELRRFNQLVESEDCNEAKEQLALVDEVLARRDALDGISGRIDKILHALSTAGQASRLGIENEKLRVSLDVARRKLNEIKEHPNRQDIIDRGGDFLL